MVKVVIGTKEAFFTIFNFLIWLSIEFLEKSWKKKSLQKFFFSVFEVNVHNN